jgi:hypothetical protein
MTGLAANEPGVALIGCTEESDAIARPFEDE